MGRQRIIAIVLVAVVVIAGVVIFAAGGDGGDGRKASIGADTTGLSISNARETEGDPSKTKKAMSFTITRSGPINVNSSVNWDTADGTANSGDYAANFGTVYFGVNETTKTVVVYINGDTADEDDETFKVVLSEPTNAGILEGQGTGTGTIVDDDGGTVASPSELIANGGFESTTNPWLLGGGAVRRSTGPAHGGTGSLELGGSTEYGGASAWQVVTIPASASTANLTFWLNITTAETKTTVADQLYVQLRTPDGAPFTSTLHTYSNLDKTSAGTYTQRSFDLLRFKGQSFRVFFQTTRDTSLPTTFRIDDVSLK